MGSLFLLYLAALLAVPRWTRGRVVLACLPPLVTAACVALDILAHYALPL